MAQAMKHFYKDVEVRKSGISIVVSGAGVDSFAGTFFAADSTLI